MNQPNGSFPLNDKGEAAQLMLTIAGREIPFWLVTEGFEGLKEGMSFLLVVDPTFTDRPGFSRTHGYVTQEELTEGEWIACAEALTENGDNAGAIYCTFNTGEEFGYRNLSTGKSGIVPYANGQTIQSGKA